MSANCKRSSHSTVREELVYGIVVLVIEEGGHVVVFFCVTRSSVAQVFAYRGSKVRGGLGKRNGYTEHSRQKLH